MSLPSSLIHPNAVVICEPWFLITKYLPRGTFRKGRCDGWSTLFLQRESILYIFPAEDIRITLLPMPFNLSLFCSIHPSKLNFQNFAIHQWSADRWRWKYLRTPTESESNHCSWSGNFLTRETLDTFNLMQVVVVNTPMRGDAILNKILIDESLTHLPSCRSWVKP